MWTDVYSDDKRFCVKKIIFERNPVTDITGSHKIMTNDSLSTLNILHNKFKPGEGATHIQNNNICQRHYGLGVTVDTEQLIFRISITFNDRYNEIF